MKHLALIFFTAALPMTALPFQSKGADGWTTFASKTRGFSILFPGTPKESQDYLPIESTKIKTYGVTFQKAESAFFILQIGDVPPDLIQRGLLNQLFENAYKLLLEYKTEDGRTEIGEVSRTEIRLGDHPGYEYSSGCGPYKKNVEKCMTKLRVYKVGQRVYVVGLSGPAAQLPREDVERFFSSFRVDER